MWGGGGRPENPKIKLIVFFLASIHSKSVFFGRDDDLSLPKNTDLLCIAIKKKYVERDNDSYLAQGMPCAR